MRASHLRSAIAVLCALVPLRASAQETPADVTDAQVAEMRAGLEPGCIARGRARGAPEHDVVSFCTCMTKVLDANVPADTWRRMTWLASQHRQEEMLPSLNSLAPLLQTCRDHEKD